MYEEHFPAERYAVTRDGASFSLTARLACPVSGARCLAVCAASWVRDAVGGDASIRWPNHVIYHEETVCAIECRATSDDSIMLTFRPDEEHIPLPAETFAERVLRAAAADLDAYPANRAELLSRYCEHCDTVMKFVDVTYRGMPVYGFAFAVDKHGGLMVMTQESRTVVTVYGGEARIAGGREQELPELPPMPR